MAAIKTDDLSALFWLPSYIQTGDYGECLQTSKKEAQRFADSFFSKLGTTDLDGQLRHIEHHARLAKEALDGAHERYRQCAKAYVTTGVSAGLCLGLLFM